MAADDRGPNRRDILIGGLGGAVLGTVVGAAALGPLLDPQAAGVDATPQPSPDDRRVDPHGPHQAGIHRPATPQQHAVFAVFSGIDDIGDWLYEVGAAITALCVDGHELLDGPGDVSVTVGLGPRLVAEIDPALPGAEDLPAFAGDEVLTGDRRRGDLCLQICASDPLAVDLALDALRGVIPGEITFRQRGFRPPGTGTVVRSPLGFHDGIAVPRTDAELAQSVFLADGPLAGGTIWVIRQFALDIDGFRALPLAERERAVGRRESDGAPLSGGAQKDDVHLGAKTTTGDYLIPVDAHVRRAHPSFTGSGLMLRRSYSYDNGPGDRGLMFVAHQSELRTFVSTQRRLDDSDRMLSHATPRATFTFVALPGFDAESPLGSRLLAARASRG